MTNNNLEKLELKLLTVTSEFMCYKYDNENKILYLDFCFSGDLSDVNFSPFAIIKEIEEEEISDAAQMCIRLYATYGTILTNYDKLAKLIAVDDGEY